MPTGPAAEYRARRDARRAAHARLAARDTRLADLRLVTFGIGVLVAVLAWNDIGSYWLLLVPFAAFVVLVRHHDEVVRARDGAARALAFYERGLLRIEDRWQGSGAPGDRFLDEHHLYAHDLDLFGAGSLFELLSIARTRAGEETLAAWLKEPAAPSEIAARQHAVAELTPALDLREALALAGTEVSAGVHSAEVVAWAEAPPTLAPPWLRLAAAVITVATVAALTLFFTIEVGGPLLAVLVFQVAFAWPQLKRVEHTLRAADAAARDLDVLGHLLVRLERERFDSPKLAALRHALDTGSTQASRAIRTLHFLVELQEWQHNLIFAIISAPFLWGTHVAWAIEAWRRVHGPHIRVWLAAVAEFEALSSLSAYRYEHPDDPFPEIAAATDERRPDARFDSVSLGHPLLPADRMVRNDVRLAGGTCLLVVSGSNMSGKSTLLRTVGINAVLALAGAPVRAASLTLSPLAVGATLRIQDSLQEGRSRFYAEITRIRQLTDLALGRSPLLFLLDELFHGTNSHDRLVGASGVLRNLIDRGAIGLITTHDLALTAVADALAPRASNVHFDDWFDGGDIRFDYRMKPGPVTRSNAIALMRAVGLDVPGEAS